MIASAINAVISHKMTAIVSNSLTGIVDSGRAQGTPDVKLWITAFSQFGAYAALILGILWLIAKVTFYILGLKYFRRPEIIRLFFAKPMSTPPPLPPVDKVW